MGFFYPLFVMGGWNFHPPKKVDLNLTYQHDTSTQVVNNKISTQKTRFFKNQIKLDPKWTHLGVWGLITDLGVFTGLNQYFSTFFNQKCLFSIRKISNFENIKKSKSWMCGAYLTDLTFQFLENCPHFLMTSCDFSNFSVISRLTGIFDTLL